MRTGIIGAVIPIDIFCLGYANIGCHATCITIFLSLAFHFIFIASNWAYTPTYFPGGRNPI
jgi:hypothetical protein